MDESARGSLFTVPSSSVQPLDHLESPSSPQAPTRRTRALDVQPLSCSTHTHIYTHIYTRTIPDSSHCDQSQCKVLMEHPVDLLLLQQLFPVALRLPHGENASSSHRGHPTTTTSRATFARSTHTSEHRRCTALIGDHAAVTTLCVSSSYPAHACALLLPHSPLPSCIQATPTSPMQSSAG